MLAFLVGVLLLSGGGAYLVGYAFTAPTHSVLRTKVGGFFLGLALIFALVVTPSLPPVLATGTFGAWPSGLTESAYHTAWVALMTVGLLAGMRVWRMRPGSGRGLSLDESPASRTLGQLPLAGTLAAALDVIAREKPGPKDMPRLAPAIRELGLHFWHQLPEKDSQVFGLVHGSVPGPIAAEVTRLLLEGAARKLPE